MAELQRLQVEAARVQERLHRLRTQMEIWELEKKLESLIQQQLSLTQEAE